MSTGITHLNATKSGALVFSAVLRRQRFLIRSLGGNPDQSCGVKMNALEADAMSIIRKITPSLDLSRHKGQAGELISSLVYGILHLSFWTLVVSVDL